MLNTIFDLLKKSEEHNSNDRNFTNVKYDHLPLLNK